MASDLIYREDAKDYVRHAIAKGLNVLEYLDDVPAANFRPVVRGHWRSRFYYRESTNAYDCEMHICSECGSEWSYDAETGSCNFNFCPNCGADMREES